MNLSELKEQLGYYVESVYADRPKAQQYESHHKDACPLQPESVLIIEHCP